MRGRCLRKNDRRIALSFAPKSNRLRMNFVYACRFSDARPGVDFIQDLELEFSRERSAGLDFASSWTWHMCLFSRDTQLNFLYRIWVASPGHGRYLPDQADAFEEDLMVWFGLASLLTGRAVEAAFCEEWFRADDASDANEPDGGRKLGGVRYFPFSLPVTEAPPWNGPISLDETAAHVREELPMFRSAWSFAGTFRYALARWYTSLNKNRRTLEDAVVDLSIALEAIFVLDDETTLRARLMRERIARYWWADEGTKKNLRTMKGHVHNVYDVRSQIVHGAIVEAQKLSQARSILDEIVREVIGDFVSGKLDGFDPRMYWMPPRQP